MKKKQTKKITFKDKIKRIYEIVKAFIKKYCYIFLLALPFILIDIFTRYKVEFYGLLKPVPNIFTLLWISLILCICLFSKKRIGKIIYILFFILSLALYLVNNIYYSMTGVFFDFSMVLLASEGSEYLLDAIKNCDLSVYLFLIPIFITFVLAIKVYPKEEHKSYKGIIVTIFIFILLHSVTPVFLGKANEELTWSTWRNPRNIYNSFNDNNKAIKVSGLYEYTVRNFYITFLKSDEGANQKDLDFLKEEYSKEKEVNKNKYTGKYKDNNLIVVQLEGLDSWLINKNDTPTLYNMMKNSINFTNHYSYYNGGGSTFNSEFAVNTGFITPLSYTQNAYTFNKNSFPYSLAHLFKEQGYTVNAFHMNTKEYYSRGTNYKNWGYDNYYGLVDQNTYKDNSYYLDRELLLNEEFKEKMFGSEKFVDYIITYTNHMPFSPEKGNCKMLLDLDSKENENVSYDLTEEDCARRQAKETDYMMELLVKELKERELFDKTTIVVLTDHYLYTLSDKTILDKYKNTSNNLINHTPFFIYTNNKDKKTIKTVTSQLNVLPTVLNLFGIDYNPNYYIGQDALSNNYQKLVFFSDYSWYDGNVYVDGGVVTNNKYINQNALEEKNYNVNYLIKKNDLTLKYNYFKDMEKSSK
ncbi:alkaline phosphatase family protein [bacterium]|nr:alkaline phosphatase family protein [bacterium]